MTLSGVYTKSTELGNFLDRKVKEESRNKDDFQEFGLITSNNYWLSVSIFI